MSGTITAITPTGDRPLAFALCQNWMRKQTVRPDQWIVVDDGKIPLQTFTPMDYVRREPEPTDPPHTLKLNLGVAIPLIKGDKIIIIEDDEYYSPRYIEEMSHHLNSYEAVGIMRSRYYHIISGGYFTHSNTKHASLAQTAFKNTVLPVFKRCLENGNDFLDVPLWGELNTTNSANYRRMLNTNSLRMLRVQAAKGINALDGRKVLLFIDNNGPLYLGIKGLPGRAGIGIGHRGNNYRYRDSADRRILKEWIPEDYQIYLDILSGKLTEENCYSYFRPKWNELNCFC